MQLIIIHYLLQIYINSWLYKNILHLNFFFTNGTFLYNFLTEIRGRRGRDRMVVGFTTTYAISAYHHWVWISIRVRCTTLCDSLSVTYGRSVVFSDPPVSSTNKTDGCDIIEILLKVAKYMKIFDVIQTIVFKEDLVSRSTPKSISDILIVLSHYSPWF
jgi:hypothetical protein